MQVDTTNTPRPEACIRAKELTMDAHEGQVSVINGSPMFFDDGEWKPADFEIISGPHTADEAADLVPFSVAEWFEQPVFITAADGTYIARYKGE
jgi:hypothetical protein